MEAEHTQILGQSQNHVEGISTASPFFHALVGRNLNDKENTMSQAEKKAKARLEAERIVMSIITIETFLEKLEAEDGKRVQ